MNRTVHCFVSTRRVLTLALLALGGNSLLSIPVRAASPADMSRLFTSQCVMARTQGNYLLAQFTTPPPKKEGSSEWGYAIGGLVCILVVVGGVVVVLQTRHKPPSIKMNTSAATESLLGNYRLLNMMMSGQTSQVWEAAEVSSGRHFAIKLLLPEHANKQDVRRFLFHEAEVGKELSHPNIIRVVAVVKDPKYPHFVMDFFPGGNLKQRILHKEQDFIREKAHDILKQTATALAFTNTKGWVHRDIKPDNILVNAAGEVRLIDFAIAAKIPTGLAKLFHSRKGKIQGTRSYMSPEQIRNEVLDGRADIYSFGATAFELVTGRPPFRAANSQDLLNKHLTDKPDSPRVYNPEVTEEFAELVLRMLAKKKEQRPSSFHEILIAMKKIKVFKTDTPKKSSAK